MLLLIDDETRMPIPSGHEYYEVTIERRDQNVWQTFSYASYGSVIALLQIGGFDRVTITKREHWSSLTPEQLREVTDNGEAPIPSQG